MALVIGLTGLALVVGTTWGAIRFAAEARRAASARAGNVAAPGQPPPPKPVQPNRLLALPAPLAAPELDLPTLDGQRFSLAKARGQVVVVNLWATWCPACVEELPSLAQLAKELAERHPGKARVVAVSVDEEPAAVDRFLARPPYGGRPPGLTLALEPGGGDATRALTCRGRGACRPEDGQLPESYIVDRQGRIVALVVGSIDWSLPGPRQYLEALLGG